MEQFFQDNMIPIFIALSVIVFMRWLPRLIAWGIPFVSPDDVKKRMDAGEEFLVIDVRTPMEFAGDLGHIPGALNMDGGSLKARLEQLGDQLDQYKTEPVLVTCRTHNRSPKAARALKNAGFTSLAVLKGGMMHWNASNLPTER